MAVSDEIAAIEARTDINDQQKRRLICALKSGQIEAVLATLPGQEFTVGGGASRLRVHINWTWVNPVTGDLHMDVSIWRGTNPQVPLVFSNPVIVTNYPPVWEDTADLVALARQLLVDFTASL